MARPCSPLTIDVMRLYWSSRDLPALAGFSARQRIEIVHIAQQQLTPPQKLLFNLFKLCLLIPAFLLAARLGSWHSLLVLLATALLYPLAIRPLRHLFIAPHLEQAIALHKDTVPTR